jgi:N-acetylglucosaminyldiphosphoundecaprenol N-acetyl-beta-D-mannosaminyltransferase
MEWAFRQATEPRRLWRRYLVNNSRFVTTLLVEQLRASWQRIRLRDPHPSRSPS